MAGGAARYLLLLLLCLSSCAASEHNKAAKDSRGSLRTYCSPSCGNHPGLVLGMGISTRPHLGLAKASPSILQVGFHSPALRLWDLLGALWVLWVLLALPDFSPESGPYSLTDVFDHQGEWGRRSPSS